MKILLTGAAGLLGGDVAGRLVDRGHHVTALINRNRAVRRNDGRLVEGVTLLDGDLGRESLGWNEAMWQAVAGGHELIVHCAAVTQFDAAAAVHRAINVDGTARVLALARAGGMKFLHVSTAYVCGTRDGPVAEDPRDERYPFANGYEASKAQAEALVRASGIAAAVARPSVVVGGWSSGAIRSFDTIYAAFRLIATGRVRVIPAHPHATIDFVPIDHVTAGLCDLAERIDEAAGRTYHLVSGGPVPVELLRDVIASVPHLVAPTLVDPARFDISALPRSERRLHARVTGLYANYFQRDPRFDDGNARAFIGRACPPTDAAFLRRLIDFAGAAGLVPSGPSRARVRAAP